MASNVTKRAARSLLRSSRPICECNSRLTTISRPFTSSSARLQDQQSEETYSPITDPFETSADGQSSRPRHSYTPERLRAPIRVRLRDPSAWEVNSDPKVLDKFYRNFLGPGGENILSEEVKWLAVTHKSFEQGSRGFNDRLAFFGRRILNLQTNLTLLDSTTASSSQRITKDTDHTRQPFEHPSLKGLENLTDVPIAEVLTKSRLAKFAAQQDMHTILRWRPRMPDKLEASGIEVVLATSVYAIIGAIALQRGGAVAAQIAKERILKPMGIS